MSRLQLTSKLKLTLGLGLILGFAFTAGKYSLNSYLATVRSYASYIDQRVYQLDATWKLANDFNTQIHEFKNILIRGKEPQVFNQQKWLYDKDKDKVFKGISDLRNGPYKFTEYDDLDDLKRFEQTYRIAVSRWDKAIDMIKGQADTRTADRASSASSVAPTSFLNNITNRYRKVTLEESARMNRTSHRQALWIAGFFILSVGVGLVFSIIIIIFYRELEEKNEQLKKVDQLKSQFVANVSHEFRNPLIVIRESLAVILEEKDIALTAQQKEILAIGEKNISRLLRLVTDLLNSAQIESGKLKLNRERVDMPGLLRDILKAYEREFAKKKMTFSSEISKETGFIWADADKISQVMINLINNAIKYTPEGGQVAISLDGDVERVRFQVSDTGPGIPPEYKDKIFDKFERIMTERAEGTGLGLPIAKDIVELHKGRLWVESEQGKGSRFIFILPRDLRQETEPRPSS